MRMNPSFLLFLLFSLLTGSSFAQNSYFPTSSENWATLSPDSLNYCPEKIDSFYSWLAMEETQSFLLLKDGKIVLEKYFGDFERDSLWVWFSAGKSLRSVLVGIAQEKGFLGIEDRSADYLGTGWTSLPRFREDSITIWHQLTMTSGLNELFFACVNPICLLYRADAGNRWAYHNGPYNLLKDVLEISTGESLNTLTREWIMDPIGMDTGIWVESGNNTFFFSRARDMARFGLLVQNQGYWGETPVLGDSIYFQQMVNSSQALNPSYGYLWWLNGKNSYIAPNEPESLSGPIAPDAPPDLITAAGAQGQFVSISPSQGLVMVRQGLQSNDDLAGLNFHNELWRRIQGLKCNTVTSMEEIQDIPLRIYPTPTKQFLYLNGPAPYEIQVEIIDLKGRTLPVKNIGTRWDLSTLPEGFYFARISTSDNVYFHRIQKI